MGLKEMWMENKDFKKIEMYECQWCKKVFRSMRHKCMFNPANLNCFSCKHCTGFETFEGQRADPETGFTWELEPYKIFKCELEEMIDEDYGDFDKLHDRNWKGNCPNYELRDDYKGKESYSELLSGGVVKNVLRREYDKRKKSI